MAPLHTRERGPDVESESSAPLLAVCFGTSHLAYLGFHDLVFNPGTGCKLLNVISNVDIGSARVHTTLS
jgi:hypothetical protein